MSIAPLLDPAAGATDDDAPVFEFGRARLYLDDCLDWLARQPANSIHAVVTDPPYSPVEYSEKEQAKLRANEGGVWRLPPTIGGSTRSPLPRFTTVTEKERAEMREFFTAWGRALLPVLTPGAHVVVAANPLLSHIVSGALDDTGLERRGEIVRLVQTMRGGDRPKNAEEEFSDVSVMARSQWEPWVVYRKPISERTVAENLRRWGTGGFRRVGDGQPFGDVIVSSPTQAKEKSLSSHPSLKPQDFLRKIVRGVLPLGEGVVLDTFAGSGSTLAAAEAVGYASVGVERDPAHLADTMAAIPRLAMYAPREPQSVLRPGNPAQVGRRPGVVVSAASRGKRGDQFCLF